MASKVEKQAAKEIREAGVLALSDACQAIYCMETYASFKKAKEEGKEYETLLAIFKLKAICEGLNRKYGKPPKSSTLRRIFAEARAEVDKLKTEQSTVSNTDLTILQTGGVSLAPKLESKQFFSLDSFKVKQVAADGHCAFRSIAKGISDKKLGIKEESTGVAMLRRKLCNYILQNKDRKLDIGMTIEQVLVQEDHDGLTGYIRAMRKSAYAGEIELMLLANMLQIQISVLLKVEQANRHEYRLVNCYGEEKLKKMVYLQWVQGRTEAGNHYNLLIPIGNVQVQLRTA